MKFLELTDYNANDTTIIQKEQKMNQNNRQNILSENIALKTIPLGMTYALMQSMILMVDTVLAGHFLSEDAVAAHQASL